MKEYSCDVCSVHGCRLDDNYPKFCPTKKLEQDFLDEVVNIYKENPVYKKIMQVASAVEANNYLKATRVEETIDFIKRMGFEKVGIACCISLLAEARIFCEILESHNINYQALSCKIGAVDKGEMDIADKDRIRPHLDHESMCNPIMQAKYLEKEDVDFIIVMGLCVGHDTLFYSNCDVLCTTLVVKDRVTCHNPVAPLHYVDGIYKKIKG